MKDLDIQFGTVYLIAKDEMSFTAFLSPVKLQKRNGLPITDSYCSDVQCAKMIAEIAAELESNLHDEIVAAKYICVMADDATDKGILENEAVCARLLNEEGVCENSYLARIQSQRSWLKVRTTMTP